MREQGKTGKLEWADAGYIDIDDSGPSFVPEEDGKNAQAAEHGEVCEGGGPEGLRERSPEGPLHDRPRDLVPVDGCGMEPTQMVETAAAPAQASWKVLEKDVLRAMEIECERYKSAQLREYEDNIMAEALGRREEGSGTTVVIRGGVRSSRMTGTTQTMSFQIRPREVVDVTIALPDLPAAPAADHKPEEISAETKDQLP